MTSAVVSVRSMFLSDTQKTHVREARQKKVTHIVQFSKSGHPNLFGLCQFTCKSWVIKGRGTLLR